jgi:predicted transcriptional regulator
MKTAISVPDELFEQADRLAKKLKMSRNKLYSQALAEFIARHAPDEVTEAMDRALEKVGQSGRKPDRTLQKVTQGLLSKVEW